MLETHLNSIGIFFNGFWIVETDDGYEVVSKGGLVLAVYDTYQEAEHSLRDD